MGCDIHLYSETKVNGKWLADLAATYTPASDDDGPEMNASYDEGRNYGLFGLLNSVRYDCEDPFPDQGMPDDASEEITVINKQWDSDGHSHNHIMVSNLKEKAAELLITTGTDANYLCNALAGLIAGLPKSINPEEQRIVFWFDN